MRAILAAIDRLSFLAAVVAAVCLCLMALAVLSEVAAIALFNQTLEFTWEIGAFLMAAAFFLGLPWTLNSAGHVRVQLFYEVMPQRARLPLEVAATAVALVIAAFLATALTGLAYSSFVDGSRTFTATGTPLVIPQAVVAFGAALLALQLAARLVRLLLREPVDGARPPDEGLV